MTLIIAPAVLPAVSMSAARAVLALQSQATATAVIGSGSWQAVATTATSPPYPTGPYSATAPAGTAAGSVQFLSIVNTGTVALVSATYTLTSSTSTGVAMDVCSGTWAEATNTCLGTISTVLTSSSSPTTSNAIAAQPGSALRVRLRLLAKASSSTTIRLTVDIPRAGARAATVTTS